MKQSLFVFRYNKVVLVTFVYFDRTGPYCFTTVVSSLGWYPFWVRNTQQIYKKNQKLIFDILFCAKPKSIKNNES